MVIAAQVKRLASSIQCLILTFLLFTICYLLFTINIAFAQTNSLPTNTNTDVPNNLHNWTQTVMIEVASALSCQLTGIDPTKPDQACLGVDPKTGKIGFLPAGDPKNGRLGGAIGGMSSLISVLYTPPAHTGDYFKYLADNFGITKKTYAQEAPGTTGTGFEGLRPLLDLWKAFRNIVYLIFVLVFIVIGLAIMLRVRIDPRTVMTIQNQIPKILIGILLVTFSYAIAGFLIDLMYLTIHIGGNLIVSSADPSLAGLPTQLSKETNPFEVAGHLKNDNAALGIGGIAWKPSTGIAEFIAPFFDSPPGKVLTTLMGATVGFFGGSYLSAGGLVFGPLASVIGGLLGSIAGFAFGDEILGGVVSIIVFLIIIISLLVALFRLWFTLIKAYVMILIDVVLAPFWIIGSIVPGSSISATGWLRDIVSNLAAFPVTIFMFLLGRVFIDAFGTADKATQFVPPLIGNRASTEAIGALIGLGIILMTPNVVNMLKAALKAPKVETGLGAAVGVGVGGPGALVGKAGQLGSLLFGLSRVPGLNKIPFIEKAGGGGTPHP